MRSVRHRIRASTISKTRGERLRHSGLRSEALFDELWQKRDVIAA